MGDHPVKSVPEKTGASVADLAELAARIQHTMRMAQQSVLLMMVFGLSVWSMLDDDLDHMLVLLLFTICSYLLLRFGLPKHD